MKNWNLKHHLIIMGLLPGLMVAIALGGYFGIQRFQDLNDLLDQRALAMAKQLAPVCEYGVMTGNIGILQNIATNMLEEKDVRSVSIYSQDMDKLAHAGPQMMDDFITGTDLNHDKLHLMHTNGSVRVRTPIYEQNLVIADQLSEQFFAEADTTGRLLGFAELELSNANTRLERYQDMVSSVSIVLIALLVCFIVSLRISKRFTSPIKDILQGLLSLKEGRYEARVRVDNSGELSQVSSHINSLAASIQQRTEETQGSFEEHLTDLQANVDELEIRNHQLSMGRNEAIEASQMKSVFLANVSHELRTPLAGIYNYLNILERSALSTGQAEHVATMQQQSDDLLRIIDDLLDLSKLEAEKLHLEHIPYHLRDVIEDALVAAAPAAYRKGISLYYQLDDQVPLHLVGDELRLKQVLGNLISNAIKFTHDGEVLIRITLINQRDQQATIQISVTDSGIGISEEQQKRLFKPFGQADTSTARQFGGTGLGLMISKALVENMNGEITVTSAPGQGSCFQFHIVADLNSDEAPPLAEFEAFSLAILNAPAAIAANMCQYLNEWNIIPRLFDTLTQLETALAQGDCQCRGILVWSRFSLRDDQAIRLLVDMATPYQLPVLVMTDSLQPQQTAEFMGLGATDCISLPTKSVHLHQSLSLQFGAGSSGLTTSSPGVYPAPQETMPHAHAERPTVLVVDDNEPNLKVVAMMIEELGLTPLKAASGPEAINAVKNHRVDLIFMDIQMPGMNGLEATRKIRQLPDKSGIPIIALTAHAMADERKRLLREGMNEYQTKPISIEQLARYIQQWTGYRQTSQLPTPTPAPAPTPAPITTSIPTPSYNANASQKPESEAAVFSATVALQVAGNKDCIAIDMMTMLLGSLEAEMDTIREAWEMESMDTLQSCVHKLHGASRYCGVPALQERLKRFESDLKQGQHRAVPDHLRGLMKDVIQLQEWCHNNDWQLLVQQAVLTRDHSKGQNKSGIVTEAD